MDLFLMRIFVALGAVFIFLFLTCVVMFFRHKNHYNYIVSSYLEAKLFMPSYYKFLSQAGFFGSFPVVLFFRKVIEKKKVKISHGEYLPEDAYVFFSGQSLVNIKWMKRYSFLYLSLMVVFFLLIILTFWI
ncbi:Uncharacterised protein [Serratia entomophila]|uniref:Uncharacterized protein n=1 Tax=Serratia entomophila TaxID=42906 RepID=A0ABY5CYC3_9GAMM|nr:hypothetical protein [Serratia entomophila]UIW19949.1 hypothetical protein KHA73_08415 [Serratia entomophila]USV02470.1 hypothetical protein KFQ06_08165 [Serratia entomophila]CAI0753866.1 Uncharacterised protein [Serratia entomophila]CAI0766442.1 Uncharacterised protein [Serratia entomophila]CAI0777691.1 Uncharacterised protein [Serratia entomophila]